MTDATWPECVPVGYRMTFPRWQDGCLAAQADGWRWEIKLCMGWEYYAARRVPMVFSLSPDSYRIAHGPAEGREVKRGDGVWIVPEGAQFWNAIGAWENVSPNMVGQPSRGVYYKLTEAAQPPAPEVEQERGLVCVFCGEGFGYTGQQPDEATLKAACDHEAKCPKNPYLARIAELEKQLADQPPAPDADPSNIDLAVAALHGLLEEYEDRAVQFGDDYLWKKHENRTTIETAAFTLQHLEECNQPPAPDAVVYRSGGDKSVLPRDSWSCVEHIEAYGYTVEIRKAAP